MSSTALKQATAPSTLQQAQTAALLSLLNLNQPPETIPTKSSGKSSTPPPAGPPVWKILVLDQQTKDVLATVLRVQDLRDVGVTLHVYVPSKHTIDLTPISKCLVSQPAAFCTADTS